MKRVAAIVGLGFLVLPLFGVVWSALAFVMLGNQIHGMDEQAAKGTITGILMMFRAAVLPGFIGIMILGFCIDGAGFRPKWLFWWMAILGILWLFYFPVGTMVGLALVIYTFTNKRKFK
jgi:hypothetical protein